MKKTLYFIVLSLLTLTSCSVDKTKVVEDTISNINSQNLKEIENSLTEDFLFIKNDTSNKAKYMELIDRANAKLKGDFYKYKLEKITETDSTILTTEIQYSKMDSLLNVKNLIKIRKTYRFKEDKIKSLTYDTILNRNEYLKEVTELTNIFRVYAEDVYKDELEKHKGDEQQKQFSENVIKWLVEYSKLPKEEKEKYKLLSTLTGTFISETSIYRKLVFKGKSTVVIYDKFIGIPFPTSYVIDEDYIRITTDKSDLLLRIKDNKTLEGEGWAQGIFKKTE